MKNNTREDIDLRRKIKEAKDYSQAIVNTSQEPLLVLNRDLIIINASKSFYSTFELDNEKSEGKLLYDLGGEIWEFSRLRTLFESLLPEKNSVTGYEISLNCSTPDLDKFLINANILNRETQSEDLILLSLKKITHPLQIREKENLKNFLNILEHAPAMIAIIRGPEHIFEIANNNYLQLVGYRDIIGKKVKEVLPEVENQGFIKILDDVYRTGEPFVGNEISIKLKIGENEFKNSYLDFVYQPTIDENGKVDGIFAHAVDVTEQVQVRKKIEESEHRYQEMVHTSPSLIATFKGRDLIIEIANDAILEAWGKGSDVLGKGLLDIMPEIIDQGLDKILLNVFETGVPYKAYEMPINLVRNNQMELCYFNFIYYPQREVNGEIIGIVNIATEVTPQALLNKRIKESEFHFRQMADLMPDKVFNTDANGNFIYFNQNWLDYTGLSSEELQVQGWTKFIHPDEREKFQQTWQNSLDTGVDFEMEIRCLNKEGKYKWHLSRAEAVKNESGNIKIWIGINIEIQKIKIEEKRKEDFLKMVSHELKTPITSIKGYVQLLLSLLKNKNDIPVSSLPIQPSLERIDHQISRLTRLISEMLDLSRIKENKLELQKENFNLNNLITETVQDINYTNTQHNIEILHDYKCNVHADKDRIGQVLINFITNAIKYSPDSREIKVRVQKLKGNKVAVSIKDQGIGIDKKNHKNIFKRFYRIGGKSEETYSGFGIGLYLANEIIQRHKGSITVKSKKGKGSEFIFTLSVAAA